MVGFCEKYLLERALRSLIWACFVLAVGGAVLALAFGIPALLILSAVSALGIIPAVHLQYRSEKRRMMIEATWEEYMRFTLPRYFFILFPVFIALGLYSIISMVLEATDISFFIYFNLIISFFYLIFSILPWGRIFVIAYNAKKMADHQILERISVIAGQLGIKAGGAFVLSWQNLKVANAFQVGVFSAYSVFLSDYLLSQLEPAEVDAIVAHELAHAKGRHSLKRVLVVMPLTLAGANLLVYLGYYASYYSIPDAVTLASTLVLSASILVVAPILSLALSRRFELQADEMAATILGPEPVVSALIKLQHLNLAKDDLSSWKRLLSSHPSISLRIQRMRAKENKTKSGCI